jgi:hypothetical protein
MSQLPNGIGVVETVERERGNLAEIKIVYRRSQTSIRTETRQSDFEPVAFCKQAR